MAGDRLRLMLLATAAVGAVVLARALFTGVIHSKFTATHRSDNPGAFWALWSVLLLPLIIVVMVALRLRPGIHS